MATHGEQRLGKLTSSTAKVIMHGSQQAWESLRDKMWSATADDFGRAISSACEFGHENEAAGAAKFFERHPEVLDVKPGGFHEWNRDDSLKGWMGSSPDNELLVKVGRYKKTLGLEVKSPTREELLSKHSLKQHNDQCQHGLLVTGWFAWYLVAHYEDEYREFLVLPDAHWQKRYLQRAILFKQFCYDGKSVIRRKLSIHDIEV
jgi:hypothetical protein